MSPEAYELHDGRFLQESTGSGGADGLAAAVGPVPAGKIWTIIAADLFPGVAETRTVRFTIRTAIGNDIAVSFPQSIALTLAVRWPLLTQGMEIKLFPGERLYGWRDVATAGSNFYVRARFIETDLPYYSYEEPLKKIIAQPQKHGSVFRALASSSAGGGGGGGGRPIGGGGGGAKPI